MMKIYNKNLILAIQHEIDIAAVSLHTFKEYEDFFTAITSANVTIKPSFNKAVNMKDCTLVLSNSEITSDYLSKWRITAPGKFLVKDYKKNNKDFIGNTLYHELSCTVNNKKVNVLVRLLNEIAEPTVTEKEKEKLKNEFGDITIDGKYFSIIKIKDESNTWATYDFYMNKDNVVSDSLYCSGSITEEAIENNDEEPVDESANTEPLF